MKNIVLGVTGSIAAYKAADIANELTKGGYNVDAIMDRVLDYCAYEDFSPDGDEHYIVSFPFIENEYYYDILLSLGDKCECLEPLHIRTEMKRRIHV